MDLFKTDDENATDQRDELLKQLLATALKAKSDDDIRRMISHLESTNTVDEPQNQSSTTKKKTEDVGETSAARRTHLENKESILPENEAKSNTFDSIQVFPVRPGADAKGRDYEIKLTSLLALRCATMDNTQNMWLGSNVNQVGDFDDTVLCKETHAGKRTVYLIQLKHQDDPKRIAKRDFTYVPPEQKGRKKKAEDFSLAKYYKGYIEMKKIIDNPSGDESEMFRSIRGADIKFILFTTRFVHEDCDFLENVRDDTLKFLNTSNADKCIFRFNENQLIKDYDPEFLSQILLFTRQVHVDSTDNQIKKDLRNLVSSNLDDSYYKDVTNKFVTFIKTWTKIILPGDNNLKFSYVLTKSDVINKLTDVLLAPYKIHFYKENFQIVEANIWDDVTCNKSITIVDSDTLVLEYVKKCFGGKIIRKYCNESKTIWGDCLSKSAQESFFRNHPSLNTKLLKIRENDNELTMFHIYQCLWFNRKLPLLLRIKTNQDYDNIVKIMKLSSFNLQIILLKPFELKLKLKDKKSIKYFVTVENLDQFNQDRILDLSVKFQGRSYEKLTNLIDKSMLKYVKSRDLIYILSKSFNIGNEYELLTKYYVPRYLYKILLKLQVLQIKNEIFLIKGETSCDDLTVILKRLGLGKNINVSIFVDDVSQQRIKKLRLKEKSIHYLVFHGCNWLEWRETFGSTINIENYQLARHDSVYEVDELIQRCNYLNNVHLLSADPGMGKSVLMDYIALQVPGNVWVLKIILSDYNEYYKDIRERRVSLSAIAHLKYFHEAILKKYHCTNVDLAQAVFQRMLKTKAVLVLMDGFDEISARYKIEVVSITKSLQDDGFRVWLTTRPHMKSHLEGVFGTIAFSLKPFSRKEQEDFLTKYFTHEIGNKGINQGILPEFVLKLLNAADVNLNEADREFTGIPLQTKLLAEVFINELERSLNDGAVRLSEDFDLLYLYKEFTKKKTDILCKKLGEFAEQVYEFFHNHQKLVALQIIFDKQDLLQLDIDKHLEVYFENNGNEMDILQKEGVVVAELNKNGQKFRVKFVHRTFTEYMAAQWLSENYDSKNETVKMITRTLINYRFNNNFYDLSFTFRMFDCTLAKSSPLFVSIINGHTEEAEELINSQLGTINVLGEGERSLLHMAAVSSNQREITRIIELVPNDKIKELVKKDIFGYSPLDYAIKSRSLYVANKICEKSVDISVNVSQNDLLTDFAKCAEGNFNFIFKMLLYQIMNLELLSKRADENTDIVKFITNKYHINKEFLCNILTEFDTEVTVGQLLESTNIKSATESYYYGLQYAVAFGTEENVYELLSKGADVNEYKFCYTPLHCSVIHNKPEILEMLLNKGADINISGRYGGTPLYFTCEEGQNDLLLKLLSKGADINKQDVGGQTPLLIALASKHVSTVKLLIENGADVCINSKFGVSPLHMAAQEGEDDLVLNFIAKGNEVNKSNFMGETPLYLALSRRNINTAKLLLRNNADVNIENNSGEICLHIAAEEGLDDIVPDIINRTFDINSQNKKGETALFLALQGQHASIAKLLLKNSQILSTKDLKGSTCLHYAALGGNNDLVLDLINRGFDIDEQNYCNETPLMFALKGNQISTAELLRGKGANVSLEDSEGNTVLHIAAKRGCYELVATYQKTFDVNVKNGIGQTPLHFSVFVFNFDNDTHIENHIKTINFLIDNGAGINIQDKYGNTALHYLFNYRKDIYDEVYVSYVTPLKTIFREKLIKLLLSNDGDAGLKNKEGKTALDSAIEEGSNNCISIIRESLRYEN